MNTLLQELIDEIDSAKVEDYQRIIGKCSIKLNDQGYNEIAIKIRELALFQINKFSETETRENFNSNKETVKRYLQEQLTNTEFNKISEKEAVLIVRNILENFKKSFEKMFGKKVHGHCNDTLKNDLPKIIIQNEYDVQHLIYPFLLAVFDGCRMEKNQDSGHHTIREDIVIDSYNIVIELKCTRESMTERDLSEEVASDIVHYNDGHIFFYIYDKDKIISNDHCFIETYENKKVDDKDIHVIIAN